MKKLIFTFLAFFCVPVLADDTRCSGLKKLNAPNPPYPLPEQVKEYLPGTSYMHIFVEGYVLVEFTVQESGYVTDVNVIDSENKPHRARENVSFEGFLEKGVAPVVKTWQFEPVANSCTHRQKFSYHLDQNAYNSFRGTGYNMHLNIGVMFPKGVTMEVSDIRVFIPSKDYDISKSFYQALGFEMSKASEDLSIFEAGNNTFFLQRYYSQEFAENLMLQLIVPNIEEAYESISRIQGYDFRFKPIKSEPWGKVIYMWGPSGELWHITELCS